MKKDISCTELLNLLKRTKLNQVQSIDNGKLAHIAIAADVELTYRTIKYYAIWCDKIRGQTIPCDGPFFAYTRRYPVAVIGQIIPWNFPLAMLTWKLGPALAADYIFVLKTAEQTPLTSLRIGQFIQKPGFPDVVLNIV